MANGPSPDKVFTVAGLSPAKSLLAVKLTAAYVLKSMGVPDEEILTILTTPSPPPQPPPRDTDLFVALLAKELDVDAVKATEVAGVLLARVLPPVAGIVGLAIRTGFAEAAE
jgi:hypothetical protein